MQGLIGTGSGLSKTRLTQMHDIMARHVENGSMPGLVALVGRHGEVQVDAIGNLAIGGAPMQRDTIFRIASMTKPVAAPAAMMLVEECKFRLAHPLSQILPEPANRHALRRPESP